MTQVISMVREGGAGGLGLVEFYGGADGENQREPLRGAGERRPVGEGEGAGRVPAERERREGRSV